MDTEFYLNLITQEHRDKPKFAETITASVEVYAYLQTLAESMIIDFDIDEAVGVQLDAVGLWIGQSRRVTIPITGVYFTWDDTVQTGWDSGIWKGVGDPDDEVEILSDELYRKLLKSKILSNNWLGDVEGAYDIIAEVITTATPILIIDNQNETFTVQIPSGELPPLEQALLTEGYILIKPAGIGIIYSIV